MIIKEKGVAVSGENYYRLSQENYLQIFLEGLKNQKLCNEENLLRLNVDWLV